MMDPATIIVAALVRVLAPGLQAVAGRAMMDAYEVLKSALIRKYGRSVSESIQQLERQPNSPERRTALERQLRAAGADRDEEILNLAEELADLVEHLTTPDPVEQVQRRAGVGAVDQVMRGHIKTVMQARSRYRVEDSDLVTAHIANSTSMPRSVRDDLTQLHTRIRAVIERIAEKIEEGEYKSAEDAIANLQLGLNERERAVALITADKQLHISYQTLRIAVEFFSGFNSGILDKIEQEESPQSQSTLMLGNAIMIYELTDFVIGYIKAFTIRGVSEIDSVYGDIRKRLARIRAQQEALAQRVRNERIEESVREQTLIDIEQRREAIDEIGREWGRYMSEVTQVDTMLDEVRAKIPTLEVIRENAALQISVLEILALLQFLKKNSEEIRGTVDALQGFRLAPLSPKRVRRLLGIGV